MHFLKEFLSRVGTDSRVVQVMANVLKNLLIENRNFGWFYHSMTRLITVVHFHLGLFKSQRV